MLNQLFEIADLLGHSLRVPQVFATVLQGSPESSLSQISVLSASGNPSRRGHLLRVVHHACEAFLLAASVQPEHRMQAVQHAPQSGEFVVTWP